MLTLWFVGVSSFVCLCVTLGVVIHCGFDIMLCTSVVVGGGQTAQVSKGSLVHVQAVPSCRK